MRPAKQAEPSAIAFATWLSDVTLRGPTAARGVLAGLKWVRAHLGVAGLPLDSPPMHGFSAAQESVAPRQAAVLPLKVWAHVCLIASQSTGTLRLMVSLILYVATLSLRLKHARRHRCLHD